MTGFSETIGNVAQKPGWSPACQTFFCSLDDRRGSATRFGRWDAASGMGDRMGEMAPPSVGCGGWGMGSGGLQGVARGVALSLVQDAVWFRTGPVRGTSSAVTLRGPWLAGGSHRGPRLLPPPHGESGPLLKCSWNRFLPTRGGDPSPEGASKPRERMSYRSREAPPAQQKRRRHKRTGTEVCGFRKAIRAGRNPAGIHAGSGPVPARWLNYCYVPSGSCAI